MDAPNLTVVSSRMIVARTGRQDGVTEPIDCERMISWSDHMTDVSSSMAIVKRMIDAWHRLDTDAISACFSDDAVWLNVSHDPLAGRANIMAAIRTFIDGVEEGEFQLHHIGETSPGVILTERTDVFRHKNGTVTKIPVMGAFEVRGGLIWSWRDYFDPAVMNY
jgi:limonene-1,2-epoxide hydrolase